MDDNEGEKDDDDNESFPVKALRTVPLVTAVPSVTTSILMGHSRGWNNKGVMA